MTDEERERRDGLADRLAGTGGRFAYDPCDDRYVLEVTPEQLDELGQRDRFAAAWRRLCAIDRERQGTHRRPLLPRGVMDEVNRFALGE